MKNEVLDLFFRCQISAKEISKRLNIPKAQVLEVLTGSIEKIDTKKEKASRYYLAPLPVKADFVGDYQSRISLDAIASKYGVSCGQVKFWGELFGAERKAKADVPCDFAEVVSQSESHTQLMKHYRVERWQINEWLKKTGLRTLKQIRRANPMGAQ